MQQQSTPQPLCDPVFFPAGEQPAKTCALSLLALMSKRYDDGIRLYREAWDETSRSLCAAWVPTAMTPASVEAAKKLNPGIDMSPEAVEGRCVTDLMTRYAGAYFDEQKRFVDLLRVYASQAATTTSCYVVANSIQCTTR